MTTILVIEDDAQTSREIEAALVDYGYETRTAFSGRDGLVKAISDPYDAIVLDRMLPGDLDGLGVLAALRAAGIHAPVLILSALTAVDERVRGLKAGVRAQVRAAGRWLGTPNVRRVGPIPFLDRALSRRGEAHAPWL